MTTHQEKKEKHQLDGIHGIMVGSMKDNLEQNGGEQGFEGAEKRLEIDVRGVKEGAKGMRESSREFWDAVIDSVKAKIVHHTFNDDSDSYILTESSLFVLPARVTMITCGTTTLLNCLDLLMAEIARLGLEVEWVQYSHKNFLYPWEQPAPHSSMEEEFTVLRKHFPKGNAFLLGPINADCYFMYIHDDIHRVSKLEIDQQMTLIMYGVPDHIAKQFYSDSEHCTDEVSKELRKTTNMDLILKGTDRVQDFIFTPCGYSMNALTGPDYISVHVTPESHCSHVSFETPAAVPSYSDTIRDVISVFQPAKFTVMIFLDAESPGGKARSKGSDVGDVAYEGYKRVNHTVNEFEPGYSAIKANFILGCPSTTSSPTTVAPPL
eukprot:TRINITY_DN67516_c14_g2_i1.p1 TRINITY_DN67516_c14_g2~~TRINITY_DN67516_c14_g2_i1.p1  ORF type:complete len:378 (+),score=36.10 TRINITY_DN67516_c14_g2_i1:25-1158(+)